MTFITALLVTESKVTKCNRMSLPSFKQKSMSQDEINQSQTTIFNNVYVLLVPGHIPGISDACSGQAVWHSLAKVLSIPPAELGSMFAD